MALVIIVLIIFAWSLIYNIFDMKHKERMSYIRIEEMKLTLEGMKITKDKKEKETKKEKTKKDESK